MTEQIEGLEVPVEGVLLQYIGIKDKLGKAIFVGDIIREGKLNERMWDNKATCIRECIGIVEYDFANYDIKRIQKGLARWDEDKDDWEFSENRYDGVYEGWEDCEVIGNMYENPELLK